MGRMSHYRTMAPRRHVERMKEQDPQRLTCLECKSAILGNHQYICIYLGEGGEGRSCIQCSCRGGWRNVALDDR
jgi:hypothetical protein